MWVAGQAALRDQEAQLSEATERLRAVRGQTDAAATELRAASAKRSAAESVSDLSRPPPPPLWAGGAGLADTPSQSCWMSFISCYRLTLVYFV